MYLPGTTDLLLNKAVRSWRGWRQPARRANTLRSPGWQGWFRQLAEWAKPGQPHDEPDEQHKDVYFEHLLDTVNPHRAPRPGAQARVLAGRWIALRRIRLGKTQADLALITGVEVSALLLLETGLGSENLAAPESWEILARELGVPSPEPMAAPAEEVLALALGRGEAVDEQLLAQVAADLGPRIAGGSAGEPLLAAAFGGAGGVGRAAKVNGGVPRDTAEIGIVLLFMVLALVTLFVLVAPRSHGADARFGQPPAQDDYRLRDVFNAGCCAAGRPDRDDLPSPNERFSRHTPAMYWADSVFLQAAGMTARRQGSGVVSGVQGWASGWEAPVLPLGPSAKEVRRDWLARVA